MTIDWIDRKFLGLFWKKSLEIKGFGVLVTETFWVDEELLDIEGTLPIGVEIEKELFIINRITGTKKWINLNSSSPFGY